MGNSNRKRPLTDSPGKICVFFGDFGAAVVGGAGNPNVEQCREFHKIRRSQGKAWYFYYAFASNKMCVCVLLCLPVFSLTCSVVYVCPFFIADLVTLYFSGRLIVL